MAPGESLPAPHTGSWATTRRVSIAGVSLEIPVDVEVDGPNSEGVYALLEFPDCRFLCTLLVLFTPDSTHLGLDGYLHRVHTIGPVRPGDEPPEVPGPPTFFVVDGERAAYMDEPCGDCTSASVVTVHKARILNFNLSLSDQEGYQPGILCRLARVATSLRWEPVQHP